MVGWKENISVAWEIWCRRIQKVCELYTSKKPWRNIIWGDCLNSEKNLGEEKFSIQHKTLQKKWGEDYSTFAGIFNRKCENFKQNEFTPDKFKCLIFAQGLMAPEDSKIRTRILFKLEQNPKISLQMVEECEQIENLWHNTARTEE